MTLLLSRRFGFLQQYSDKKGRINSGGQSKECRKMRFAVIKGH